MCISPLSLFLCVFPSTGDGTCLLTGPSTSPENNLPAVKNVLKNSLPPPTAEEEKLASIMQRSRPAQKKSSPAVMFPFVAMSPAIGEHNYSCFRPLYRFAAVVGWCPCLRWHVFVRPYAVRRKRLFGRRYRLLCTVRMSTLTCTLSLPLIPILRYFQDVAIVRQLLEDFVISSREAVLKLELLQQGDPSQLSGLPGDWTTEDAPRLFNPPGMYVLRCCKRGLWGISLTELLFF